MKNMWLPLILGAVGSFLLLKHMRKLPLSVRLAGRDPKDPAEKNFGAFPVDIPENQFYDFFL
jgi:hypothetical protein